MEKEVQEFRVYSQRKGASLLSREELTKNVPRLGTPISRQKTFLRQPHAIIGHAWPAPTRNLKVLAPIIKLQQENLIIPNKRKLPTPLNLKKLTIVPKSTKTITSNIN